jgi:sulfite exporter TauE/SafE
MNQYLIAFITGLTTGGLSCLAVQGGLLASSLAHQIEQDMLAQSAKAKPRPSVTARPGVKQAAAGKQPQAVKQAQPAKFRPRTALPIALFLAAKVSAYTLLGFLLGALGTVLQLTPMMRAILMIAIGIFMVGNALRMFNIHPIFRFFALEPPKFVTRYIRKTAKKGADLATPLFLGALTVLIPCGITQAMMAVAIGTGDPLQGALLMLAFTLGTSPVFFVVAYLTTQIGARLEKWFMRFVATVVLVLGIVTYISGLRLAGVPVNLPDWLQSNSSAQQAQQPVPTNTVVKAYIPTLPTPAAAGAETTGAATALAVDPLSSPVVQAGATSPAVNPVSPAASEAAVPPTASPIAELTLNALTSGYEPQTLYASAGVPVKLTVVTNNTRSCAIAFVIPDLNYETLLPVTGVTAIDIPAQSPGKVMAFTCSMGMYTGQIVFK